MMNSISKQQQATRAPWYKVGMVWLMIGLPLSVVVASMVTVVIAHQNAPIIVNQSKAP